MGSEATTATPAGHHHDNPDVSLWPFDDQKPPTPAPHVAALIPAERQSLAVAVSCDDDVVNIWCVNPPTVSQLRAWEQQTGRYITVTLSTENVVSALLADVLATSDHATLADVLSDIELAVGDISATTTASPWPVVNSFAARVGQVTKVKTGAEVRNAGARVWSLQSLQVLAASVGITETVNVTDVLLTPTVRATVTGHPHMGLTFNIKPLRAPTLTEVLPPAVTPLLTALGPGIVVVGSSRHGGRSSLAWALSTHAGSRGRNGAAVLSQRRMWPNPDVAAWTASPDRFAVMADAATAFGPDVLLVDDLATVTDTTMWNKIADISASGVLCVVTVPVAQLVGLAPLWHDRRLRVLLRGIIVRDVIATAATTVPIDDTLVFTPDVMAALAVDDNVALSVTTVRDLYGLTAGTCYDTSLARAVRSQRLGADVAGDYIRHEERFAAAMGQPFDPNPAPLVSTTTGWTWTATT